MKNKKITGFLAALTFLLAAVVLQLYFNKDHYFAMNRAKCSFTMIVLMGAVLTAVVRLVEGIWVKQEKQRMTLLDWCVLVFGCSSLVTCVLSQDPGLTFVGTKGMFVGAFSYITGMLVYFTVSRNMLPKKWIVGLFIAASALIFVWTIVNQCGTDMFGMHQRMQPGSERDYVSSMGNINSACIGFAVMISFVVFLFLLQSTVVLRWMSVIIVGLLATYTLHSEGVFVGLLVVMPFLMSASFSNSKRVRLSLCLLLAVGLSLVTYHFLCFCNVIVSQSEFINKLSGYWIGELITALSIALLRLEKNGRLKFSDKTLKLFRVSLSWLFVAVIAGFVGVSVFKSSYDPNYGSWRGAVWKGSVWAYRLYNPVEKVFGQGSGMFANNVTLAWSMFFGRESTLSYATCHNIFLQALLGNGFIGLACLLTGLFSLFRDWVRDLRPVVMRPVSKYESIQNVEYQEMIRVASFIAIIGFIGTSLVESTYPHMVMLFFAMLALYRSSYFVPRKKSKKDNTIS